MSKRVIGFVAAASVVLIVIWYLVLFSPQSKSLRNANSRASSANTQAAALRSQIQVLQEEKAQLPAARDKLSVLKLALPDTPVLDKLIDDINVAAGQAGIDWQTVSPSKPTTYSAGSAPAVASGFPGGMQAITVAMSVSGTYHQVTDFITKLNGISRLFAVVSVNLSGVGPSFPKVGGQINGQVFFVPPPAGTAPATTPTTVTH